MSAAGILGICLSVAMTGIEAGDKVVTLTVAPVMSGKQKLAEVQPGIELTAKDVKGPWVFVVGVQDGKKIRGWLLQKSLVAEPSIAFAKLVVHYQYDWHLDKKSKRADKKFESTDTNSDRALTLGEFLAATRKPTLDDLNNKLRSIQQEYAESGGARPGTPEYALMYMRMHTYTGLEFEGWRTDWMRWAPETGNPPPSKVAQDFLRTQDVRRSRLAQALLDREDPDTRRRRAQALFKWADVNRDERLSRQEVGGALNTLSVTLVDGQTAVSADVQRLAEDLRHNSHIVRKDAARALGQIGPDAKPAVTELANALQDEQYVVRNHAIKALQNIGPDARAAVPALITALRDKSSSVRRYAAEALGKIGPDAGAAVSALRKLLQDESSTMRRRAENALKRIDPGR